MCSIYLPRLYHIGLDWCLEGRWLGSFEHPTKHMVRNGVATGFQVHH